MKNGEGRKNIGKIGMIKQVNKDVQDNYTIQGQKPVVKLPKSTDLSKKKENIHHKYLNYKKNSN